MDRIVVFADHTIGYDIVTHMISKPEDCEIVAVYTNRTTGSWWKSLEDNIEIASVLKIYDPENSVQEILNIDVDYILALSWKHIIPKKLIRHVRKHITNLHYSLLPKHRGVYPVNWAIRNGDLHTGVSIHFVDEKLDTGAIIMQESIEINWTDDAYSLLEKLDSLAMRLFNEAWKTRSRWNEIAVSQASFGSYHSRNEFYNDNLIKLQAEYKAIDLINLLRSRSFKDKSTAYFIDENSGKRYTIFIRINDLHE